TLFVGAALLFLLEPMIARMVLPKFGGSPAVWTTCMVFFQAALLGGYVYAHATATRVPPRWQVIVHLGLLLLAVIALPIRVPGEWAPPAAAHPTPWLLAGLGVAVGLPFLAVAATAPLLQRWFAGTDHPGARNPYVLYAASNVGSVIGLLSYPTLVEPFLTLQQQAWVWSVGYLLLV